ncbi:radical SAM protein [Candidatus Omnitrophota bacterium]
MNKRIKKVFVDYIPTLSKVHELRRDPQRYALREITPTSCTLMLTDRCNLKCVMCAQYSKVHRDDELSAADWKGIIKDLKRNGIKNIHFSGGEPLLRKDALIELVAFCRDSCLVTGLTTNGTLIEEEALNRLIGAGLRSIAVSIDALDRKYDEIRGVPRSFEKVRAAVTLISEIKKKKGVDAYINFTLFKETLDEFTKVKGLADDHGLPVGVCLYDDTSYLFKKQYGRRKQHWIEEDDDHDKLKILLQYLRSEKRKNPRSLLLNFPMIDYIGEYFKDPLQRHIPCVSSQDRIIVDPYGMLMGGCLSMGSFGSLKSKTFGELKNEDRYKRAKKNMFYKECPGCSCGYQYNIRCLPDLVAKDCAQRIKNTIKGIR